MVRIEAATRRPAIAAPAAATPTPGALCGGCIDAHRADRWRHRWPHPARGGGPRSAPHTLQRRPRRVLLRARQSRRTRAGRIARHCLRTGSIGRRAWPRPAQGGSGPCYARHGHLDSQPQAARIRAPRGVQHRRLWQRPLVVYLPDVVPGWAVKAERRLATRIATTTEAALAHLPAKKTTITGYPVRAAFFSQTRAEARAALGIPPSERVVVITGATQGAHALNEAVFRALRDLVEESIVFHITGPSDFDDAAGFSSGLGPELAERYHVSAFRDDLPTVMLAADVG